MAICFDHITFLVEARLPNRLWQYSQDWRVTIRCKSTFNWPTIFIGVKRVEELLELIPLLLAQTTAHPYFPGYDLEFIELGKYMYFLSGWKMSVPKRSIPDKILGCKMLRLYFFDTVCSFFNKHEVCFHHKRFLLAPSFYLLVDISVSCVIVQRGMKLNCLPTSTWEWVDKFVINMW